MWPPSVGSLPVEERSMSRANPTAFPADAARKRMALPHSSLSLAVGAALAFGMFAPKGTPPAIVQKLWNI